MELILLKNSQKTKNAIRFCSPKLKKSLRNYSKNQDAN